jgi:hypothetical protein
MRGEIIFDSISTVVTDSTDITGMLSAPVERHSTEQRPAEADESFWRAHRTSNGRSELSSATRTKEGA